MDDQKTPPSRGDPYVPTTTHAEWGAGHPRLHITSADERFDRLLDTDLVRIGSAATSDILLPGADALHATVQHDEQDEYVVTMHGAGELTANPQAAATHEGDRTQTLRTGARFTAGPWTLVFLRDEFADHGRPYGGREGGEGAHQRPQPSRPDYAADPRAEQTRPLDDPVD